MAFEARAWTTLRATVSVRTAVSGHPERAPRIRARVLTFVANSMLFLMLGVPSPRAQQTSVCSGTMSASPLRPIAKPLVVSLERPKDFAANPELLKAFLNGVQSAGPKLAPKGTGTTNIDLSFSVRKAGKSKTYKSLIWLQSQRVHGDIERAPQGAHVDMTVYARDAASRSLVWTGAISCVVQTDNVAALAEGLGRIVGRSLGESVPKAGL